MRFKQRLKVIQSLEDTAKRSVVWTGLGLMAAGCGGPGAVGMTWVGCSSPEGVGQSPLVLPPVGLESGSEGANLRKWEGPGGYFLLLGCHCKFL